MPDVTRVALLAGLDEARVRSWLEAGFFERVPGHTPDWVARAHVLAQLEKAAVPADVLLAADREGVLARAYVFEFLQMARQGEHPLREVVQTTGIEEQFLLRLCDALGFDDPSVFSDAEVSLLEALAESLTEGLPRSMAVELCELWGAQMRFIAYAEVMSYDTNLAQQTMGGTDSPLQAAAKLAPLTRAMLRAADLFPLPLHRRHLLQALDLKPDTALTEAAPGTRVLPPGEVEVAIGFVDLTGFTSLTEREGDRQALAYARRLERLVRAAIQNSGVRIVKRLGDGFMLAGYDPASLIDALVHVVAMAAESDEIPTARAGMAFGRAVSRAGDYFGHTVNLAARVLDEAEPSEVLVTEEIVDRLDGGPFAFRAPRDCSRKGLRETVRLWRAEPISPRPPPPAA